MDHEIEPRFHQARERLEAREAALEEELDRLGRYVLVLALDDLEFLIDPRVIWKPPRVLVRRGDEAGNVWLARNDLSFLRPPDFSPVDQERILARALDHFDELVDSWYDVREDVRRGRIARNTLVD